jgi:hypothetical protein
MIWKILIVILVLDLIQRAIQYGPYELRNVINYFRQEKVDKRSWEYPYNNAPYCGVTQPTAQPIPGVNKDSSEQDQTVSKERKEEHIADFIETSMSQQRKKNCI